MSWLGDCVYSIREAATANLRKLTDVFGVEWAKTTIIPQIMVFAQHTNYLYRMTMIFAITVNYYSFLLLYIYMYKIIYNNILLLIF